MAVRSYEIITAIFETSKGSAQKFRNWLTETRQIKTILVK